MGDDGDNFPDQFTRANANLDFIAAQFADVLRNLMRAASSDDPSDGAFRASQQMDFVVELLSKTTEKFGFYHLFMKSIEEFKDDTEWASVEHTEIAAARRGMKYLVERSCSDSAARGRASRRRTEFLSAIKHIDEMKDYRLRKSRMSD